MTNCKCSKCNETPCGCRKQCCEQPCGCAQPTLSIDEVPESVSMLKFNVNGVSTWFDYQNLVDKTQTDTNVFADKDKRVIVYNAERHQDILSAKQLGSILHLADIEDVDLKNTKANSLLVFDEECNAWMAWNSSTNGSVSLQTAMGFGSDGKPLSLSTPTNASQYYMLGWNAGNKLSYSQPVQFSSTSNKAALYIDKTTKQIGWYEA